MAFSRSQQSPTGAGSSPIAGAVLPIRRAEELLSTLPGVMAARIIASDTGAVDEIHILTSADVAPKQTVRNVESALIAHLGMRVDHRKISVATTSEGQKAPGAPAGVGAGAASAAEVMPEPAAAVSAKSPAGESVSQKAQGVSAKVPAAASVGAAVTPPSRDVTAGAAAARQQVALLSMPSRAYYFEDIEVRRSRLRGLSCRVTLKKGDESFVGEAEGMESERSRIELAARAALKAIKEEGTDGRPLDLTGALLIEAFGREFVFVGVTAQQGRSSALLTGTCEVKDSPETASVLAVLDATNRWIAQPK
ncbi:MAG: hypothetical protein ACT4R6_01525 [Gemmatimonadaceae bacterium]